MGQHTELERKQWFDLVQEYEVSGLSREVFCKQKEVSLNTFTYYRSQRLKQNRPVGEIKSPFIELSLTPTTSDPFRLIFPNGISLALPQQFDQQQLIKLMEVLRVC